MCQVKKDVTFQKIQDSLVIVLTVGQRTNEAPSAGKNGLIDLLAGGYLKDLSLFQLVKLAHILIHTHFHAFE